MAADWSGARIGEQRHLWVAEWDVGAGAVVSVRALTRSAAANLLEDHAAASPDLVAGLDFGFSLPMWWLEANRISDVGELWSDAPRLEGWLAGCHPPFWGRPGRGRPDLGDRPQWRRTEMAAVVRPRAAPGCGAAPTDPP